MSIKTICEVMDLNRSSYYLWVKRADSERKKANKKLTHEILKIHNQSKGRYGSPRITMTLRSMGYTCGFNRVALIMKKSGVFGCAKKKFKGASGTDSKHNLPIAPRVFEVETKAHFPKAPNQVWVSDTTYIATREGWLYLTIQLDVFTRKIVGYSLSDHLKTSAVWESMRLALTHQQGALSLKEPDLIAHSDRGCQYASEEYREKAKDLGITQSMSRTGNCYDNAYAETFFHSFKVELVHRNDFQRRSDGEIATREYIDWYNNKRLHSGLGYQAPMDYERKALAA